MEELKLNEQRPLRIIVAGGRDFSDYDKMCSVLDPFIGEEVDKVKIISGGAQGADKLGEKYAKESSMDLIIFPADWSKYGKSAGHIRNKQMAEYGDMLFAFWDGESRGTKNMIDEALKANNIKEVRVIKYEQITEQADRAI